MSEQLQTNSSFFSPVPMNPSARFMYSFSFASATFAASIVSKLRISVRLGWSFPYFSFMNLNQFIVTSVMWARSCAISFSSALMRAMSSSALSLLNLRMRCIFISMSLIISSRVTSRINFGLKGSNRLSICATTLSMFSAVSNPLSL